MDVVRDFDLARSEVSPLRTAEGSDADIPETSELSPQSVDGQVPSRELFDETAKPRRFAFFGAARS